MIAVAEFVRERAAPNALTRALFAGTAWGILFAIGSTVLAAWNCGIVCLEDAAATAVVSSVAGVVTFGPLAAFTHPKSG